MGNQKLELILVLLNFVWIIYFKSSLIFCEQTLCGDDICEKVDILPAVNYPNENINGYCLCTPGKKPEYEPCFPDGIFDKDELICIPSATVILFS